MTNRPPTRAALTARLRERYPAVHALFLRLGDCLLEVRTSEAPLRDELARYFAAFLAEPGPADVLITAHEAPDQDLGLDYRVKQPDPGKTKVKEEWADIEGGRVVHKRLTGMSFLFGGGEHLAVGPCRDNPNQVVNFVNNRFIERKLNQGCLLGHAAGIRLGARGMAMAGFSGMGKSTLALHCMSRGADFVSNDRVLVAEGRPVPTMFGVAKHPRINPGTALANPDLAGIVAPGDKARFLALPEAELWSLEHKYDAIIEDCFGPGRFTLAAPLDALVLLNWTRDGGPLVIREVDLARREDLLPAFMKATGLFYLPERPDLPQDQPALRYADVLSRCTVLECSGGVDFDAAADACLRLLHTGQSPART